MESAPNVARKLKLTSALLITSSPNIMVVLMTSGILFLCVKLVTDTIIEKQTKRIQFLKLMAKKGVRNLNKQKAFIYEVLRSPWMWDKINYLLDCMEEFDEDGNGKLYKSILVNTYFKYHSTWKVANIEGVSEGVIQYRKKEAIILLGILIWIYCDIREKEDVAKGVIKRMHNC